MKPLHVLFGASLLLNGIVIVYVLRSPKAAAGLTEPGPGSTPPATTAANVNRPAGAWSEADFNDFSRLSGRLREAGFPPPVIKAVVTAAVRENFLARQRAILPKRQFPAEFWKNQRITAPASNEVRDEMRDLDREQWRVLQAALGSDYAIVDQDDDAVALRRRRYGDLPLAKIVELEKIKSDYADLAAQVKDESLGLMRPADYEKLALLEREKRADLERLLTPAGLLDYELHDSPASSWMRARLGQFDATEQEFRALYAVRKAFDDTYAPADRPVDPEIARGRFAAEQKLEDQFREVLGAERYAEYLRAKQPGFSNPASFGPSAQTLDRIVARLELPTTTTASVVAVQEDFHRRANQVLADRELKAEQRQAQLQALGREAMMKLTQVMGGPGFSAYQQNGGQWVNELMRPMN